VNASLRTFASELRPLIAVTAMLFLITAVMYPLAVTGIAQGLFPGAANGSIVEIDGEQIGSSLVGQQFTEPYYFHGRPSAAGDGYDAAASSGSNLGPTSAKLLDGIAERAAAFREENGLQPGAPAPADAVTASGSGLDPHVSPATARLQVERVAAARNADAAAIRMLVEEYVEGARFGFIGQPRVNVLELNIALDERFPLPE
jgi:K+-transporting ATPase ATPase C chain